MTASLLLFFQDDTGALIFGGIVAFVVTVAIVYVAGKWNTEKQKKLAANPEEWYASRSPAARQMIYQQVGDKKILIELSGAVKEHIAVTKDTVYSCNSIFGRMNTYPIDSISAVEVENAGMGPRLKILMPGAVDNKENSIMFNNMDIPWAKVQQVAQTILEQRSKLKGPGPQERKSEESIPDLLKQLSALKESGVISDQEFEGKKKELLSRI